MNKFRILWADDEIDLLKPHIIFLTEKGYDVVKVKSGQDAIEFLSKNSVDIVFLDENMPGLSGLETLEIIKDNYPTLPVVMVTKSEEEAIMDEAIGSKISDYLIKPVKPNQLLLCLKKNLDHKRLVSEKTVSSYQIAFRKIGIMLSENLNYKEWTDLYKKLVYWELELEHSIDESMKEILKNQENEANTLFAKYYESNYKDWLHTKTDDVPTLSHTFVKNKLLPYIDEPEPIFFIVIDNLRFDQWHVLKFFFEEYFRIQEEEVYFSIIPTATQYARNSLFSGLMPSEIAKIYPDLWIDEDETGNKNDFEADLFRQQLKRFGKGNVKFSYHKVLNFSFGKRLVEQLPNLFSNKINIIVYNFIDMLAHSRTDTEIIRELAEDESAYRSVTQTWFSHSPLFEIIKYLSERKCRIILTTDHGSIKVENPIKVIGDRNTNTNIRYKHGKNLNYNPKEVFEIKNPSEYFLPRLNISSTYIFSRNNDFFVYPNNYNHFVNYYKNTFQHGGISMQEIMIPFISMIPK